jgi:hypothetical protein
VQTPGHALINLALLGKALGHEVPILLGALLPDVPIMILYLRERLRGTPEDTIWAVHYQKRFWQAVIHGGHSIPLTVLGAVLAWLCKSDALLAFFASALFHALGDLPVHAIDAHRHFLPLSQYRFQSPLSYWDPRFHARYVALVEALAVLASSIYVHLVLSAQWQPTVRAISMVLLGVVNVVYAWSYWRNFLR